MTSDSTGQVGEVPAKRRGLSRILAATHHSLAGLRACARSEEAFRLELALAALLLPLALFLGQSGVERALLVLALGLVLLAELLNSAVETVVDRVGLEYDDLSKKAKDIASAAVFVSLVLCPSIWALVLVG